MEVMNNFAYDFYNISHSSSNIFIYPLMEWVNTYFLSTYEPSTMSQKVQDLNPIINEMWGNIFTFLNLL